MSLKMKPPTLKLDGPISEAWWMEEYEPLCAVPILTASSLGLIGSSHDVMNAQYLTKFRMPNGGELTVETNEGWIEVDGLRISMEILRKVAKKIHDEENHYEKDTEAWCLPRT